MFDRDKIKREVEKGTQAKLAGLRCGVHGEAPVVSFDQAGELQLRGCCNAVVAAAHGRLGGRAT